MFVNDPRKLVYEPCCHGSSGPCCTLNDSWNVIQAVKNFALRDSADSSEKLFHVTCVTYAAPIPSCEGPFSLTAVSFGLRKAKIRYAADLSL